MKSKASQNAKQRAARETRVMPAPALSTEFLSGGTLSGLEKIRATAGRGPAATCSPFGGETRLQLPAQRCRHGSDISETSGAQDGVSTRAFSAFVRTRQLCAANHRSRVAADLLSDLLVFTAPTSAARLSVRHQVSVL
jgi:hypothetical protein